MNVMQSMDPVEFSVIEEGTKVIVPQTVEISDTSFSRPFCVAAEDPDVINLSHVFEGLLFIKGWTKLSARQQEKTKGLVLEGFEGDAWKYEERVEAAIKRMRIGSVGFGKVQTSHHQCKLPIQAVLAQVTKANPTSIVVSTLYSPWEVGLLIAAMRLLQIRPPAR